MSHPEITHPEIIKTAATITPPLSGKKQKHRFGPHPLGLHVAGSGQVWSAAATAFPLFQAGHLPFHPDLQEQIARLQDDMKDHDSVQLMQAVMKQARKRFATALAGITAYQTYDYRRSVPPVPLFCQQGTSEIRDYGAGVADDSPVLLAVPSLVNPAYILDLQENHSFMRFMAGQGIHPYLVDWVAPGPEELALGLEGYITKRLMPLIRRLVRHHRKKIHLLGYCMGGNLALAAARIMQEEDQLASLNLVATPWDFHAGQKSSLGMPTSLASFLTTTFAALHSKDGQVPMALLQLFFYSLDPTVSDRKFRRFSGTKNQTDKAHLMVAIEDWANDGPPLSAAVARDCLLKWYVHNQPCHTRWQVAGQTIDPSLVRLPGQIITPCHDRIVSPASAQALQEKLPHFDHKRITGGHVSMIAGKNAATNLWPAISGWIMGQ